MKNSRIENSELRLMTHETWNMKPETQNLDPNPVIPNPIHGGT